MNAWLKPGCLSVIRYRTRTPDYRASSPIDGASPAIIASTSPYGKPGNRFAGLTLTLSLSRSLARSSSPLLFLCLLLVLLSASFFLFSLFSLSSSFPLPPHRQAVAVFLFLKSTFFFTIPRPLSNERTLNCQPAAPSESCRPPPPPEYLVLPSRHPSCQHRPRVHPIVPSKFTGAIARAGVFELSAASDSCSV
ncbi:hypothetical protein BO71DRAFT_415673 [Aspergillus ellipticus CBS 707.79]|uniref:Transmembrane protein n=1 Tax=Aspergillus ellipticus CBS 707.79 TaxID=1448320 RepID=A0A319DY88_9EURO|nr:hypothetical protein BO71DRAFT_415673 [Aspergillus ellipticus CBS 707.79]